MLEHNPILSKYIMEAKEDDYSQQTLCLRDDYGNIVAKHTVYALGREDVQKHFSEQYSEFFNCASLPFYTGKVESYINGQGIGMEFWKYGEKHLNYTCKKPYYRFIYDVSETHWSERHLPELLQYLDSIEIPVEILFDEVNEQGEYNCLLLFKDTK